MNADVAVQRLLDISGRRAPTRLRYGSDQRITRQRTGAALSHQVVCTLPVVLAPRSPSAES